MSKPVTFCAWDRELTNARRRTLGRWFNSSSFYECYVMTITQNTRIWTTPSGRKDFANLLSFCKVKAHGGVAKLVKAAVRKKFNLYKS